MGNKKHNPPLLLLIIFAIAAGIGCGYFFPEWLARVFITFNGIFSQFLNFCIPLIILGFVAPAIFEIGTGAGKMLVVTAILAYVATIAAGFMSYFTSVSFFPQMIEPSAYVDSISSGVSLTPFFSVPMPPLMDVMSALVISFVLGLGIASLGKSTGSLRGVLTDFRDIVVKVINRAIVPLLPIYIFGIFLNMTETGEVGSVISTFMKIIVVIFVLHIVWLLMLYVTASFFSLHSKNPLKLIWTMMPAYFTALGTQSSAATIPVTLRQTFKMGVSEEIGGFTIPLCATIHLSGSALKIVACSLAIMIAHGMHYDLSLFSYFIFLTGITLVAAPGVPGGAIMAALGLLSSILGFSEADNALIIALYIAMDSFGTACNVTGDGALTLIVERIFKGKTLTAAQ